MYSAREGSARSRSRGANGSELNSSVLSESKRSITNLVNSSAKAADLSIDSSQNIEYGTNVRLETSPTPDLHANSRTQQLSPYNQSSKYKSHNSSTNSFKPQ